MGRSSRGLNPSKSSRISAHEGRLQDAEEDQFWSYQELKEDNFEV